ncbi:MAG: hypothetical protein KDA84_28500 [Planctomycetaceae bacterium]|nr:hypothetical protein [Planctomycetaceae bacterium]
MSQAVDDDVTFSWTTIYDTAIAGDDYTAVTNTGTIPAGKTRTTITVDVIADDEVELDEQFFVELSQLDSGASDVRFDPRKIERVDLAEYDSLDTLGSANDVEVMGSTADIADGANGLRVLDATDPTNITELGFFDTTGNAVDVELIGEMVYVADGDSGLRVLDVSDLASIAELGFFDTPGNALDVELIGGMAYIADNANGLRVLDVRDPANISELGFFDTPGTAMNVDIVGSTVYVADDSSGLRVLDVTDPANISELGAFNTAGSANAVKVLRTIAYVANGENGVMALNVGDPGDIRVLGDLETPDVALDVEVINGLAYTADGTSGLRVLKTDVVYRAIGMIQNDDFATLSVTNSRTLERNNGNTIFTFNVALDRAVSEDVTFDFATADDTAEGADFTIISGSDIIPTGQTSTASPITVEVLGDSDVELDEQFFLELFNLSANCLDVTNPYSASRSNPRFEVRSAGGCFFIADVKPLIFPSLFPYASRTTADFVENPD